MTVLFITLLLLGACAEKQTASAPSAQDLPNEPEPDEISHMDIQKVSFPPISRVYSETVFLSTKFLSGCYMIVRHIEGLYNTHRIHSSLNY